MPESEEQEGIVFIPGTNLPSTGPGSPVELLADMPIFVPPGGFPNAPANGAINLPPGAIVNIPGIGNVAVSPGLTLTGLPAGTTWASWGGLITTYTLPNGQVVILGWGGRNGLCIFWGPSVNPPPTPPPVNPIWWAWVAIGSVMSGTAFLGIINGYLEGTAEDSFRCDKVKNACISQITLNRQWIANIKLGFNVVLRALANYFLNCPNMSQACKDRAVAAWHDLKAAVVKMNNLESAGLALHEQVVNGAGCNCAPFGDSSQLIGAFGAPGPLIGQIGTWLDEIAFSNTLFISWAQWLASFRSDCYCRAAEDEIFRTFVPGLPPVPGQPPIQ